MSDSLNGEQEPTRTDVTQIDDDEEQHQEYDEQDEIEEMKKSLANIEAEAKQLEEMQLQVENAVGNSGAQEVVDKGEVDSRSVFIGNVDFSTVQAELEAHFKACGAIERVTILSDKWTGQPKGFAYIEFLDKDSVANALELSDSVFKGRVLKVTAKRTNVPTFMMSPRGRGGRGGGYFNGSPRGRGRGFVPRGRGAPRGGRGGYRGGFYG
jgi:polyadenylate-binding protein 2